MIELIIADRCVGCGACAETCPTNVFDTDTEGRPVIARQENCQTCFMCELYCPADALFVGPDHDRPVAVDPDWVRASGHLGQYRRDSGWDERADDSHDKSQFWRMSKIMGPGRHRTIARRQARED